VSGADGNGERAELHRVNPAAPGLRRVRRGKGFQYLSAEGDTIDDPIEVARIKSLAVPPAWRDVWICPDPAGHIQAVGTDAAGRRQYRYHDQWRAERDREKFDRVLRLARRLADVRIEVAARLDEGGLRRPRVLAGALRMLELGAFRVGGDEYAPGGNLATGDDEEEEGSFGLATLRREHVRRIRGEVRIAYPAKGGVWRELALRDKQVHQLVGALLRRRAGEASEDLLVYRLGRDWHDVRSDDVNDYLKELAGDEFTAKDLRTWNATVLAAVALARVNPDQLRTKRGRKRVLTDSYREVAEHLGNTPTVAKQSYVDPRVVAAFEHGRTIAAAVRRAAERSAASRERTRDVVEPAVIRLLSRE
jgi:DNA topoisomerase IB